MELPIEPGGLYLNNHRRKSARSKSTFSKMKVRVMGWFGRSPKKDQDTAVNVPKIVVTNYEAGETANTGRNTELFSVEKSETVEKSEKEKDGRTPSKASANSDITAQSGTAVKTGTPLKNGATFSSETTAKSGTGVASGTVNPDGPQSVIKKPSGSSVASSKAGGTGGTVGKRISFKCNNDNAGGKDGAKSQETDLHSSPTKHENDDLSRARQEVIAQVRAKIAQDRGKGIAKSESNKNSSPEHAQGRSNTNTSPEHAQGKSNTNSSPEHAQGRSNTNSSPEHAQGKSNTNTSPEHAQSRTTSPVPPPIPPTKAKAIAKIKQKIAEARQEEQQSLALEQQKHQESNQSEKVSTSKGRQSKKNSECEKPEPEPSEIPPKDLICNPNPAPSLQISPPTPKTVDPAARAATMNKIKQAILAAALAKAEGNCDHSSLSVPGDEKNRRRSFPSSLNQSLQPLAVAPTMQEPRRRRSSSPVVPGQDKKRSPLIWNFFEQSKTRGVCRTCGYAVGVKHNTGGLVRHLSLVHPREYRCYTTKMDENWTHGMMEKNLNMRVPKRF